METSPQSCNDSLIKLFDEINSNIQINITRDGKISNLTYLCYKGYESDVNEKFSEPLVWIGVYVAIASFCCNLGMVADLLLGIRNKCYQIPSKFSSVNVTSMMLIAIAMKLTVDLSGSMPGNLDQAAKIGSIAFMSTMMAISNPSLASMNDKSMLTNIVGLAIFVITIAVNLLIQIGTGVITNDGPRHLLDDKAYLTVFKIHYSFRFKNMVSVYIGIMLLLLLISIATAIIIPSIKKILEFKYQVRRKTLNDQNQHTRISTVEELTQHVTRYWIMAKSGSPQFIIMAINFLSYTSLTLCIIGMGIYTKVLSSLLTNDAGQGNYESDYKWSIPVILITQFIGNAIGTLIVFIRCIRSMKLKEVSWESTDIFNLRKEKYWTNKLVEWKGSHIGCLSSYPSLRTIVHFVRNHVLNLFIGLQKAFLVLIYTVSWFCFIAYLQLIIIIYDALISTFKKVVSRKDDINRDLRNYVLQLDDEVQPSQKVVEIMSKSMNRLIERAKKKQNNTLLMLLEKSNGFEGVESFDDIGQTFGFSPLPLSVTLNSWSVPVITLTCIAIAVPGISKYQVDSLIKSIDNALLYTDRVEESFNSSHDYVNIRKTTALWYEVKDKRTWLKNPIKTHDQRGQLPKETLTWFAEKAEAILRDIRTNTFEEHMINFPNELIAAHSMHRISRSILSSYQHEIATKELFFELLTSMIADILVACFSNIPQVIMMKCHENEIEKREASVDAAAKLLGKSTDIIRKLEACKLPSMDPEKMASIHEWRLHLKQSSSLNSPPSNKIELR